MKKKNNVMMIAVIAITLLMIGCVVVMGIIRNSNRNNPDVKPPEQTTDLPILSVDNGYNRYNTGSDNTGDSAHYR